MCWAHTTRAIDRSDYLKAIRAVDSVFTEKLLHDLVLLQWMVQNEGSFKYVFKEKYIGMAELKKYMTSVWVESKAFRWYEGAHFLSFLFFYVLLFTHFGETPEAEILF